MIQRICPICDQTMKHPHYCRNCKSWVSHPHVRDVTYYLNERHPQKETNCSYHPPFNPHPQTPPPAPKHPPIQSPPTAGWTLQNNHPYPSSPPQGSPKILPPQKTSGVLWIAAVIVIITILASTISTSLRFVRKQISPPRNTDQEIPYDEEIESWESGWWAGEDWDDEYNWDYEDDWEDDYEYNYEDNDIQILEDEEVIQAGVACNGNGHFNVSGAEMEELAKTVLQHYGYEIKEDQIYRSSYNVEYPDYDGGIPYTIYSSYISIIIGEDEEDSEEYLNLEYDTATGQLHGIHLWIEDKETMLGVSIELLELIEKQSKMPEGIWSHSVKRDMPGFIDVGDGYSLNAGNVSIQGYRHQQGYWFNIRLLSEPEESQSGI